MSHERLIRRPAALLAAPVLTSDLGRTAVSHETSGIWRTHFPGAQREHQLFFGAIDVDIEAELAQLGPTGYRPLRVRDTRCERFGYFAAVWPDGSVCRTCECRALRIRGRCPGCGEHRILPGLRPADGAAVCAGCAGFRPSYACASCGQEDQLHARRLCTRCTLSDRLAELLDDGTGRIRPELAPLHAMLVKADNPRTGLNCSTGARRTLARPRTYCAVWAAARAAAHLRDLLMACGLLPTVDKQICMFEQWLTRHLTGITDPDHAQIVRRFATWDILPRLRARADRKPITPAGRQFAGDQVRYATAFLGWLADRGLGLAECRQADIDAWHAEHKQHYRKTVRGFLLWC
jgi:hypothetical protein